MRKLTILIAGVVTALAVLAIGCGGSDEPELSVPEQGSPPVLAGGGLVVPNTYLTYEGGRYELIHFIQAEFVDEGEFRAIGEATDAEIDFSGKLTIYERVGDSEAVYTLSPETADDEAMWLRWRES
jgi:hypothetical protein